MERKTVCGAAALARALNDRMALWLVYRVLKRSRLSPKNEKLERALCRTRKGHHSGESVITLLLCKYARLLFKAEVDEKAEAVQLSLLIATLAIGGMQVLLSLLLQLWY